MIINWKGSIHRKPNIYLSLKVKLQITVSQYAKFLFIFVLQGLSEFIIEDVRVNVQTLAVTINLRYDSLLLDGEYDLTGKLVKVIPLSARGPFTVTTTNSRVSTGTRNDKYMLLKLYI